MDIFVRKFFFFFIFVDCYFIVANYYLLNNWLLFRIYILQAKRYTLLNIYINLGSGIFKQVGIILNIKLYLNWDKKIKKKSLYLIIPKRFFYIWKIVYITLDDIVNCSTYSIYKLTDTIFILLFHYLVIFYIYLFYSFKILWFCDF